jgi:hypothetical protein
MLQCGEDEALLGDDAMDNDNRREARPNQKSHERPGLLNG